MISVSSDKKNVRLEIGGPNGDTLSLVSKEHYDAIVRKLESSHALSTEPSSAKPASGPAPPSAVAPVKSAEPKSVHWANSPDSEIPPRSPSPDEPVEDHDGTMGIALYDFTGDAADELSVKEGEILLVVDQSNEDWWKCRNQAGQEGVIPASYIDLDADDTPAPAQEDPTETDVEDSAEREREEREEAAAAATAAAAKREKERKERERVEREEEEERARAAEQKRVAEERRKADELKKKAAEAAKQRKLDEEQSKAKAAREKVKERGRRRKKEEEGSSSGEDAEEIIRKQQAKKRREADERRDPALRNSLTKTGPPPEPGKTRVWHDRTGQFRVEAEFKGFDNGKLRLHKTNGVTIEVPAEKMSAEDMAYIARLTGKSSNSPVKPTSPRPNDDNIPLAKLQAAPKAAPKAPAVFQSRPDPQPKKHVDWFEFFLNAGCDMDDCSRYAAAFERDKIDETLLPDLKADTLRSLGLREGDILRTLKAVEKKKWVAKSKTEDPVYQQQLEADRRYAEIVQEALYSGKQPPPPPGPIPQLKSTSPAPNLFSGPGGVLKDNTRRGRPSPSVNTRAASINVDESVLENASAQLVRGSSPAIASPVQSSSLQPVAAPKPVAAVGFGDDDTWAIRPSSTKPTPATSATPPVAPSSAPPAPPAPPAPAPAPVAAPAIAVQPPERPQTASSIQSPSLTPEQDLLAKIAELANFRRPPSAPALAVQPTVAVPPPVTSATPPAFVTSPSLSTPTPSFNPNAPRGPFAPIPVNQALLKPLVPTNTGMVGFIPTRSNTNLSPSPILPQQTSFLNSSFINQSPTGINPGSTGFHPTLAPQPTGFTPSLGLSPTGFIPSLAAQPTGIPPFIGTQPTGFYPGMGGMGGANTGIPPVPPLPSSKHFDTPSRSYTHLFPDLSSFNALSAPPQSFSPPPQPAAPNHSPANVFASMKAGNFGGEEQHNGTRKSLYSRQYDSVLTSPVENYDALRGNTGLQPQPTGWVPGFQSQFQPSYGSLR
jgi:chemotaxis protein histidine kinase CheA